MTPSFASLKTNFTPSKFLQPFYIGGKAVLDGQVGRLLVTTLHEDVLLTDLRTGRDLARIQGDDEDNVTTLALTPKATHLIIFSQSCLMRIYSLTVDFIAAQPTVELVNIRRTKAHATPVVAAETDPSGRFLATGSTEGLVKVWDIHGGYVTHNLHGHSSVVSALRFFAPAVSVPWARPVADVTQKRLKRKRNAGKEPGTAWMLASGANDGQIRVWDLVDNECLAMLETHSSTIRGLDWSVSGKTLISGSRDKTICIWRVKNWGLKHTIPASEELETVGFLKPGVLMDNDGTGPQQAIYAGGKRNTVRLWDVSTGKELTKQSTLNMEIGGQGILDILYYNDISFLLSVHSDHTLVFHQLLLPHGAQSLPVTRRIPGYYDEVLDLAYLQEDSSLLAIATNSEEVRIISLTPEQNFGDAGILHGHTDIVICLDRDWSGTWLATGSKDNDARLWNISSSRQFSCYATFTGHAESVGAISMSHSPPPVESVAYREKCPPKFLITGSLDRTVKKWDVYKNRASYTRKAHEKDINSIDVSADDTLFASASQDTTVKIWSVEDGECLGVLRGHKRGVWCVRFAPASFTLTKVTGLERSKCRNVVTGSSDRKVKLWSLMDYSCLKTFEGHTNSVLKTIWISSGLQIASSSADGLVKVWDVKSGECSTTLDNHKSKVWALALHRDDHILVSGGNDSVVTFWEDVTAETASSSLAAEAKLIEQEQAIQNYMSTSEYRPAITLALNLNNPGRLLHLFKFVTSQNEPLSLSGVLAVDEILGDLPDSQLATLICRLRDWNTNIQTALVAQKVFYCLAKTNSANRFFRLRLEVEKGVGGASAVWDALGTYTERHYKRIEALIEESYILDYTLGKMDEILIN